MIDVYYWPTPNGHKIRIFMEEAQLPHRIIPVNIGQGDQFKPAFLAISPNNRMPAIVDQEPRGGGAPVSLFESGGSCCTSPKKRAASSRRRFMAAPRCCSGCSGRSRDSGRWPYAIDRYIRETKRLYGVLNRRLADREYIAGEFSIADIASYPWIVPHEAHGQNLADFPHLERWFNAIKSRPATIRAYEGAKEVYKPSDQPMSEEAGKILFGQSAATVSQRQETARGANRT